MFKNVYVCGDTHSYIDIAKLDERQFPVQKIMNPQDDLVIILGDFGFIWEGGAADDYWVLKYLENRNFTIAFVDGNHENFDLLEKYPVADWCGGRVHIIRDGVYHLMRGEIFEFGGKSFFCFGGAHSTDKHLRVPSKSWWSQEVPTKEEKEYGVENLTIARNKVDYILTHDGPASVIQKRFYWFEKNDVGSYFDFIKDNFGYQRWFFGHHHIDYDFDDRHRCVYQDVIKVV